MNKFKKIVLLLLIVLSGCNSKFKCGYDPRLFEVKEGLYIESKDDLNINSEPNFVKDIVNFGVKNDYCIANDSSMSPGADGYLINIQLIKGDQVFYFYGVEKLHITYSEEIKVQVDKEEVNKFCDFIAPYYNKGEAKYFKDAANLCELKK